MSCPQFFGYIWSILNILCGLGILLREIDIADFNEYFLCWFLKGIIIIMIALIN